MTTSQETTLRALRRSATQHDHKNRGDVLSMMPDALVVRDVLVIHPAVNIYVMAAARGPDAAAARRDLCSA
jgi:hypothetical protein